MGWLFQSGTTRRGLIAERIGNWERQSGEMLVKTECLAHCYRGNPFSGVLWSVWKRTFVQGDHEAQPEERWIQCDLLRYSRCNDGWGYKDMEESMHPYFYSCPLGYLELDSMDRYGGNEEWRKGVRSYHARQSEKRALKRRGQMR